MGRVPGRSVFGLGEEYDTVVRPQYALLLVDKVTFGVENRNKSNEPYLFLLKFDNILLNSRFTNWILLLTIRLRAHTRSRQ